MRKLIAVLLVLCAAVASSILGGFAISSQQMSTPLAGSTGASAPSGPAPIIVSEADKWKFKKDDSGRVVSKDEERDLMVQKEGLSRTLTSATELSMFKQDSTQDADASQELDPRYMEIRKLDLDKEVIIAATPDLATQFDSPPETLVLGSVVKIEDAEELVLSEEYLPGKISAEDAIAYT